MESRIGVLMDRLIDQFTSRAVFLLLLLVLVLLLHECFKG